MESDGDKDHDQLVEKLTTGFGAMLEQVQMLARRNIDLEKRLARVREEYRLATEDGESSARGLPVWLRQDKEGTVEHTSDPMRHLQGSQTSEDNAIWYMGATGQDNALAIVGGVEAWKVLTNGKGPLWRKFNREEMAKCPSRESSKDGAQEQDPLPTDHSREDQDNPETVDCPFSAMAHLGEQGGNEARRPDSLPTPPLMDEHYVGKQHYRYSQDANATSPPPSVSGSASKCPIRMMDERSPEEVAQYFEIHKHEIPRSHEICVKRFQSNAQSIQQLDAKYGNLVNMLQGLGMKHQPLLPAQEGTGDYAEMDGKSAGKVEKWAKNVDETPADVQDVQHGRLLPDTEGRQGHFDRPLKDIRVGESPSRPWGISVPEAGASKGHGEGGAFPTLKDVKTRVDQGFPHPQTQAKQVLDEGRGLQQHDDKPGMVFTGPVFIGYGAEQAAALIEKCGWDPSGPSK